MTETDLLIIGAGPGGYRAAAYAARHGLRVAIVEEQHVGGTCLNRGCIPTKTLCHEASVLATLREAGASTAIDYPQVEERVAAVVGQLRQGVEQLLQHPAITLLRGHARFCGERTVTVGTETVAARHIIIATGSAPKLPPIDGLQGVLTTTATFPAVMTSDTLLQQLHSVPETMAIVGAGVIGMEFASIFSRFGTRVTVIEYLKECLPTLDSDVAKRLRKVLEKPQVNRHGQETRPAITFCLGAAVQSVAAGSVTFERKGKAETVAADVVLIATGRQPRTNDLHLEAAGIAFDRRGITTGQHFETTAPGIYAIGDVNGRQLLAHAAEMQAISVVNRILGQADTIRLDIMPAAIFTAPEAASVGPSEDGLKVAATPYECRKAFHRANGKALAIGETEGMVKLLSEPGAGRIVGCHAFGAHAADIVQEVSALMCRDTTVSQLRSMVHIHPTLSEVLLAAAEM